MITTVPPQRVMLIDVLRGIALFGILIMNIVNFSNPHIAVTNLNIRNEYSGPNYYTWWIVEGLFEGSMRTLFSMLFGASCILMLEKLKHAQTDAAEIFYRRCIWLFLFGFLNAFIFVWPGDILYVYGICGLFLYPLYKMKPRYLLAIAGILLLLSTGFYTHGLWKKKRERVKGEYALLLERQHKILTIQQAEEKEAWLKHLANRDTAKLGKEFREEVEALQKGSYAGVVAHMAPVNVEIQSKYLYESYFLDALMMILAGMALLRYGVLSGQRSLLFYFCMLAIAYGIGLPLSYYEHHIYVQTKFDSSLYLDKLLFVYYDTRRLLLCLGHTSLIIILFKTNTFKALFRGLSKVGQMAFTNYLMQSIICAFIFYGFGFGLFGKLQRYEINYVVAAIWLFQFAFSILWLKHFRFGPFEWLWRSLTYWKVQPMKKQ